jgi:Xaa-Pro dipeptidase
MDSATETAICLGRTYVTTEGEAEPVNAPDLDLQRK